MWINQTKEETLEGLAGMRLTNLRAGKTGLRDLVPLRGTPVQVVDCIETPSQSIEPIRDCEGLVTLGVALRNVTDLQPRSPCPD